MIIEILGAGCPKCKKLAEVTEQAIKELGVAANIVKVTDINEIANRNVMITPALSINGEIKSAGRLPNIEKIKEWLQNNGIYNE